ncbi:MAG TPA: hypothetical protein VMZ22_05745 [Acidimicrobiales bacterium]|nr:hypothetical protein [Acidimicrobiales bacterium]
MVGDISEPNGAERAWTAPSTLLENTHLLGVAAVVALAATAAFELIGVRLHVIARHFMVVFVPLMCASAVAAFSYRVMTALTAGANIGGVVALLFGIPVAAGLAIIHVFLLRDELRRERFGPSGFKPRLRRALG